MKIRRGFLYAVEAIIASIIMLTYIIFALSSPKEIDWASINFKFYAKDILLGLERLNLLENISAEQDFNSMNAIINSLKENVKISTNFINLPKKEILIGVVVGNESTGYFTTTEGNWNGEGLPSSEKNKYRQGIAFGVKFVLSDKLNDGVIQFNAVNFDFNNNGNFGDSNEGPFEYRSFFTCNTHSCKGIFQVGFYKNDLILYNASFSSKIDEAFGNFEMLPIKSSIAFYNFNPEFEGFGAFDIILLNNKTISEKFNASLEEFLKNDKSIIEVLNENFTFYKNFGILSPDYELVGTGPFESKFHNSSTSLKISKLFHNSKITITNISRDFTLDNKTLFNRGWNITGIVSQQDEFLAGTTKFMHGSINILIANGTTGFDKVYFSTDYDFSNKSSFGVGEKVQIFSNNYKIISLVPFSLIPLEPFTFSELPLLNTTGEKTIVFKNYRYEKKITSSSTKTSERPKGVADSCNGEYGIGNFSLSRTYNYVLTNFSCDPDYDYINIDLDNNNNYNDTVQGIDEGIYQNNSKIILEGRTFNMQIVNNTFLHLTEITPDNPGPLLVKEKVLNGHGNYVIIPKIDFTQDYISLLRSIIVYLSTQIQKTDFNIIGEEAFLTTHSGLITGEKFSYPYIIEMVWWRS